MDKNKMYGAGGHFSVLRGQKALLHLHSGCHVSCFTPLCQRNHTYIDISLAQRQGQIEGS